MTLTGSVVDMSEEAVVHAGHFGLAVVGHALARHWLTDPEKVRARTEELRTILDGLDASVEPYSWELRVRELDVEAGYEQWAPIYDGPNPAIETETPIFRELLTTAPRGRALDAACGTGRHAAYLVELGYDVVGVDASSAMLEIARAKVPAARMELGMLESLPLEDDSVDLVTCSLALTHVPDLAPVMREFARVAAPRRSGPALGHAPDQLYALRRRGVWRFPHGRNSIRPEYRASRRRLLAGLHRRRTQGT